MGVSVGEIETQLARFRMGGDQLLKNAGGLFVFLISGVGQCQVHFEAVREWLGRRIGKRLLDVISGRHVALLVECDVRQVQRCIDEAGAQA